MPWYSRALPHRFEIFGRPVCGAPRCPRSERRDLDRAERFEDVRNVDGGVGALLLQLDHQGLRLCVGLRGATGRRILNPWGGWKLKPCQNIRILHNITLGGSFSAVSRAVCATWPSSCNFFVWDLLRKKKSLLAFACGSMAGSCDAGQGPARAARGSEYFRIFLFKVQTTGGSFTKCQMAGLFSRILLPKFVYQFSNVCYSDTKTNMLL